MWIRIRLLGLHHVAIEIGYTMPPDGELSPFLYTCSRLVEKLAQQNGKGTKWKGGTSSSRVEVRVRVRSKSRWGRRTDGLNNLKHSKKRRGESRDETN